MSNPLVARTPPSLTVFTWLRLPCGCRGVEVRAADGSLLNLRGETCRQCLSVTWAPTYTNMELFDEQTGKHAGEADPTGPPEEGAP